MMPARNAGSPRGYSDGHSHGYSNGYSDDFSSPPPATTPLSIWLSDLWSSFTAAAAAAKSSQHSDHTSLALTTPASFSISGLLPSQTSPAYLTSTTSTATSSSSPAPSSSYHTTSPPSTFTTSNYPWSAAPDHYSRHSHFPPFPATTTLSADSSTNHLSTGPLVAAILVPILAVLLLSAFFLWLLRHRRNSNDPSNSNDDPCPTAAARHTSSSSMSSMLPASLMEKFSRKDSADGAIAAATHSPVSLLPPILPPLTAQLSRSAGGEPEGLCVGDFGISRGSFGHGIGQGDDGGAASAGAGPPRQQQMPVIITSAQNNSYFTGLDTSSRGESGSELGEEEEGDAGQMPVSMIGGMGHGMGMGMGMGLAHHHGIDVAHGMGMAAMFGDPPPPYVPASQEGRNAGETRGDAGGAHAAAAAAAEGKGSQGATERRGDDGREGFPGVQGGGTDRRPGTARSVSERSITSTLYSDTASVHSARATRVSTGAPLMVTPPEGGRRGSGPGRERERERDPFDDPSSSSGSSAANSVGDLARGETGRV